MWERECVCERESVNMYCCVYRSLMCVCDLLLQVKHLEVSCSSMADDICKKSAIIETYVMDSRIGMELSLSSSLSLFVCLFSLSLPVSFTLYFLSLPLIAYQHGCLFVGHRPPGV